MQVREEQREGILNKNKIMICLVASFFLFVGCNETGQSAERQAPIFSLENVDGSTVHLSDYANHVIILNFFATWCPPCKSEIPDFVSLLNEHRNDRFIILGVAVNVRNKEELENFISRYNINYPVLIDDGFVSSTYGPISSIPTTFIIDREGQISQKIIGSRSKEVFENLIEPLL